jgi:hypothetical protein
MTWNEEKFFGFGAEQDPDKLILDNASCQDVFVNELKTTNNKSPGFASTLRNHANGYPPNSPLMLLDALLLVDSKFRSPRTIIILEVIRVATKIVKELSENRHQRLEHLD